MNVFSLRLRPSATDPTRVSGRGRQDTLLLALTVLSLFFPTLSQAFSWPEGSLLFSGQREGIWDLYLWTPSENGENPGKISPITQTPEPEGNPVYWPRKGIILCSKPDQSGKFGIVGLDIHGRELWRVDSPTGNLGWPQPSPWDDRILAVLEDPATGWSSPGLIKPDSREFVQFPDNGLPGGQPTWISPDSIVLSRVRGNEFDLVRRDLSSGEETVLVSGGRNWLPTSSPQGGAPFFFTRRVGQQSSIFQLLPNETPWKYENFSHARQYDWQASVSPDGQFVTFLSLRDGRFSICLRPIANDLENIVPIEGFSSIFHPSWVPLSPSPNHPSLHRDSENHPLPLKGAL